MDKILVRMNENIEKISTAFSFYEIIALKLNFTAFERFKTINFFYIPFLPLLGEIIYKWKYYIMYEFYYII